MYGKLVILMLQLMKNLKLKTAATIVSIFIFFASQAQTNNFAPIGAKWWYGFAWNGIDFPTMYYYVESKADTVVYGKICRKLESSIIYEFSEEKICNFYLYENNDTIYYSIDTVLGEKIDTSFHILYDFSADVGDSWEVHSGDYNGIVTNEICPDDIGSFVVVDSIGTDLIEGLNLERISYHSELSDFGTWSFGGDAYRLFGGTSSLLPITGCIVKDPFPDYLLCYEDPSVGILHFIDWDECALFLNINQYNENLKIFPNPTNNILFLSNISSIAKIELYNLSGSLLRSYININSNYINLDSYNSGQYILRIITNTSIVNYLIIKT